MQRSLILFVIVVGGSTLIPLVFLVFHQWRDRWRYGKQVVATIEQIQIWLNGWYVAAIWTDALTGESYIFYSQRIEASLQQKIGDSIIVDVDPDNFERYHIVL